MARSAGNQSKGVLRGKGFLLIPAKRCKRVIVASDAEGQRLARPSTDRARTTFALIGFLLALSFAAPCGGQSGTRQSQPAGFLLIRSVSGSKSEQQGGRFVITDPRTVFSTARDRQVIVYFEWKGTKGKHHIEGRWKGPNGRDVIVSSADYTARQNTFGFYFKLALSKDVQPGLWALNVSIDGEPAGTHTIEIKSGAAAASAVPKRHYRTPAEIYKMAVGATVSLAKLASDGTVISRGSGFFIRPDTVLTSFDAIDGASALRLVTPDGKPLAVHGVLAWNRVEDWAVLRVPVTPEIDLKLAPPGSWAVGDDYFSLQMSRAGDRTLVAGTLSGTDDFPHAGRRLHLSYSASQEASGAPILNDYGEVYGIMTFGSLAPGLWSLSALKTGMPMNFSQAGSLFTLQNVLAVPITEVQIPAPGSAGRRLSELQSTRQFIGALRGTENVQWGTVTLASAGGSNEMRTPDTKFNFTRAGGPIQIDLHWYINTKIKSHISLRVYNLQNQLVTESLLKKFHHGRGQRLDTRWKINITQFPPGLYRADVELDEVPVWRVYFQVNS